MKQVPSKTRIHFFICCRHRDDGKICCAKRHSEDLVKKLREWVIRKDLKEVIKVSRSLCLGFCEKGITACLYPHNKWFTDIRPSDGEKIMIMLEKILEEQGLHSSILKRSE